MANPERVSRADQMAVTFKAFETAAVRGDRAPDNFTHGTTQNAVRWLCKDGRIKVYIYRDNYRMVEILTGPNKGLRTAPHRRNFKPWKVIGVEAHRCGKAVPIAPTKRGEKMHVSLARIGENLTPA